MDNYWNERFIKDKLMWGDEPSKVVIECEKIIKKNNFKNILIMGIGYGRNGKYFIENGYNVDGVECSKEAIILGKEYCPKIDFINGSVLDIRINKKYEVIFCYSILHLFTKDDRNILIENCINHCIENGVIIFSCFSIKDKTFGIGEIIEENTYEKNGKIVHFFDEEEMMNIHKNLKNISLSYSIEDVETIERKEKYNMIYGIYKIRK